MEEKYLKIYLDFRNKQKYTVRRTMSITQKGIAKQQPTSDHARDCKRYEKEIEYIMEAIKIIDSRIDDKAKRARIQDLGIDTRTYNVRVSDSDLARMRFQLISELYMFDYAIKHLRDE